MHYIYTLSKKLQVRDVKMHSLLIILRGKVITGIGDGKKFANLPWFKRQVVEMFNFEPYPGTLNLMLKEEFSKILSSILDENRGFKIVPENGHFSGFLYRAFIGFRVMGAIVKPSVPGYPESILEIIAPVCLREFLGLNDGDEIDVAIFFE
jgi:CTP-dependent riboflavin kinase